MLRFSIFAALLALAAAPALAQTTLPADGGTEPLSTVPSNVGAGDTKTLWAPQLPVPAVSTDAAPKLFVQAAQAAIAAGRLGEAQEAIERAESRVLDRSVVPSRAGEASGQSLVRQLAQARQALAGGDRMAALQSLADAAANPEAAD